MINFYTILPDFAMGILVFYCLFLILTSDDSTFTFFSLLPALSVLALMKMVGIVFAPMILLFWVVTQKVFDSISRTFVYHILILAVVPVGIWKCVNMYISKYVIKTGGQSYANISIYKTINTVFSTENMAYRMDLAKRYIDALFRKTVFEYFAFIPFVLLACIIIGITIRTISTDRFKKTGRLALLWVIIATVAYVLFMYIMYLMMFSSYEASKLAGYYRYMSTFLITVAYLMCIILFLEDNLLTKIVLWSLSCLIILNFISIKGLADYSSSAFSDPPYIGEGNAIKNAVGDDEKVYLVICGSDTTMYQIINYHAVPIIVQWGSPGKPRNSDDVWSKNFSKSEFKEILSDYDYIYFLQTDDIFWNSYGDLFEDSDSVINHTLYRMINKDGRIYLEKKS